MKKFVFIMVITMALGVGTLVQANNLSDRGVDTLGNRLIYDQDLNITWYDFTKTTDTWSNQRDWAANLTVTMANGREFTDWRLPTTLGAITQSTDNVGEMAHLFYTELGNSTGTYDGYGNLVSSGLLETGLFTNLLGADNNNLNAGWYWSGTELYTGMAAYIFSFSAGANFYYLEGWPFNAMAVRDGDVAAVPLPPSLLLLASGFLGVGVMRRFQKKL
jgi:hypothetical protein